MAKVVTKVSVAHATEVINDHLLIRTAGASMQVLGLKFIAELELADPLPLYPTAWAGGHCQRDVAGTILAKIGTSPEF